MITTAPAPADAGSPADSPLAGAPGLVAWYAEGFSDVLGDRLRLFDNAGPALELLRFDAAGGVDARDSRRRCARASTRSPTFSHPAFARVRALTRARRPVFRSSPWSPSWSLASVCRRCCARPTPEARGSTRPLRSGCCVRCCRPWRRFTSATGGAQHRLLDADRIVLTPAGEIAITEYVFGGLSDDLLPAPRTTDVGQVALLAVAILLGRPLRSDELDPSFDRLVRRACSTSPSADVLRPWLTRALTLGPDRIQIGAGGLSRPRRAAARRLGLVVRRCVSCRARVRRRSCPPSHTCRRPRVRNWRCPRRRRPPSTRRTRRLWWANRTLTA